MFCYGQVCTYVHTDMVWCKFSSLINEMHETQLSVYFTVDEWTMEEKVVFERAFHMHGKHFHRIKAFVSVMVAAWCFHVIYITLSLHVICNIVYAQYCV